MSALFPVAEPGAPDTGPAARPTHAVLGWILRAQRGRIAMCALVTSVWLGSQQLVPFVVGRAVQQGVLDDNQGRLAVWTAALGVIIAVQSATGIASHRFVVRCRLDATFRTQQAVMRQIARLGAELNRRVSTGEVISVTSADAARFGQLAEMIGLCCGALVSFAVVVAMLTVQTPALALVVLLGMPALLVTLLPVFRALEARQTVQREHVGALNTLASDTVMGLRVLRGIGGEPFFQRRYLQESEAVRDAGTAVARSRALIEAARVLLPGLLLLALVWAGARMAVAGTLPPGDFIAFFGYLMFLTRPLQFGILSVEAVAGARVSARRLHAFLSLDPQLPAPADRTAPPRWPATAPLYDPHTEVTLRPGRLTAVTTDDPARTAGLLDRLARHTDSPARYGELPLRDYPLDEVRARIHLMHPGALLFSGDLRGQLDTDGQRTDEEIVQALHTAAALDVVGLDPALVERDPAPPQEYALHLRVAERGREFSGGQRQRLALARALLTGSDTLLLDDPTSAVDAHTEERITSRLRGHRAGRTTVVLTSSPTVLAAADEVVFLGRRLLRGRHQELLEHPDYRTAVTR